MLPSDQNGPNGFARISTDQIVWPQFGGWTAVALRDKGLCVRGHVSHAKTVARNSFRFGLASGDGISINVGNVHCTNATFLRPLLKQTTNN